MYISSGHSSSSDFRGLTLLELLAVISIISVLVSISVPSLYNYVQSIRLRTLRNEIINDIKYVVSASQKYGGNCSIQFNQFQASSQARDRFAANLKCVQNSAQLALNNASTKYIPLPGNDIFFLTNLSSLQVGNHGAIVGHDDHIFVIGFRQSMGTDINPVCFTLERYNSSVKIGTYPKNIARSTRQFLSKIIPSLNPSQCS